MKILVLGHKGMLGSDLTTRLSLDHEVTGKDVADFDLASENSCRKIIDEAMPQVVVNAAAYTNVDGAETNQELCWAVNAHGVKNLALACRDSRIKIVHFSTDYVFDGTKKDLYTETDTPNPINVYGAAKLAGERFLQDHAPDFLLIRTAWLYGKNGKNFIGAILGKAKTDKALSVVDDQIGSPTYTQDLAAAVKILIEGGHNGIFHLTNRGLCSWYEYALKIIHNTTLTDVTVTPSKSATLARPAKRPLFSGLSNKKFMEATGKTMRVWQLALLEFMDQMDHSYL
jgi:dTDP-4-dehydrorhamnose reductase